MEDIPLSLLLAVLALLLLASAFFSGAEIGLMSLNRYRLRQYLDERRAGAAQAKELLERPDRLIGLVLLWSNFINSLASGLATFTALRLFGDSGIAIATGAMTLLILLFTDITPKTLAALHPERIALPAALVLKPLGVVSAPVVRTVGWLANGLLRLLGVDAAQTAKGAVSPEELRSAVLEAGALIPKSHQSMLLSILELEQVRVEDVMVSYQEIVGIDLAADWEFIEKQVAHSAFARLPVYRDRLDEMLGFLYVREVIEDVLHARFDREALLRRLHPPYYVPEGTPLNTQLLNFQREQRRIGLVVDEYGDLKGLVTLEDILEEIVGEFTTDPNLATQSIVPEPDGSYLVDGGLSLRKLSRLLGWKLPSRGAKTLNGAILEYLETIPEPGTGLLLAGYPLEIVQTQGNTVRTVRIKPRLPAHEPSPENE